ncbi:hypothetical protein [Arthrobacter sp. B2a2-09]|nr:hypothetical protein [Arthrobacter sp. B2a2-09]
MLSKKERIDKEARFWMLMARSSTPAAAGPLVGAVGGRSLRV